MENQTFENLLEPLVLKRENHIVSRSNISEFALKVLYRLRKANYAAYLVGGGVRDLLLGRVPKDFDIATDALPEDVNDLFRNGRLIGRRFRLVHVHFGREIIEVATFRGHGMDEPDDPDDRHVRDGMLVRDNVYGTLEEDAWRRDFTINALYYNIRDFSVVDYTGGLEDIKSRQIRMIGDPERRYREDPVRMLRAVRFAAKLDFNIETQTETPLYKLAERLQAVPPARLFEEVLKLFIKGEGLKSYRLLREYGLFGQLFPATNACLLAEDKDEAELTNALIEQALDNTDKRIAQDKPVTPAFLFAVLLWQPMLKRAEQYEQEGMRPAQAHHAAAADVISEQVQLVSIPKRFSIQSREIWTMQARLQNRSGKRAYRLASSPRFRAAYDFLLLRCQAGEGELQSLCDWWTDFQQVSDQDRSAMVSQIAPAKRRRHRKKSN